MSDYATLKRRADLCANDPMWADHAEVPKLLMRKLHDAIEALEAENKRLKEHNEALDEMLLASQQDVNDYLTENKRLQDQWEHFQKLASEHRDELEAENKTLKEQREGFEENIARCAERCVALEEENKRLQDHLHDIADFVERHWKGAGLPLESGWIIKRLQDWGEQIEETDDENERLREEMVTDEMVEEIASEVFAYVDAYYCDFRQFKKIVDGILRAALASKEQT